MQQSTALTAMLLLCSVAVLAQGKPASYTDRRHALQQQGRTAMQASAAREAAHACESEANTAATVACARAQQAGADAEYRAYKASITGLLRLGSPDMTGPERDDAQQTLTQFRRAESLWLQYRDTQCEAVAHVSCETGMTFRHMHELSELYDRLF